MKSIEYVVGDATRPQGNEPKIIVHVCNDIGAWGKGFVLALSRLYKEPEQAFKRWAAGETDQPYQLGAVQFVQVQPELWVANLIGQHGVARKNRAAPPIRYEAIRQGLTTVAAEALSLSASVHMPRIGAGLAGGDWDTIERIIQEELCVQNVSVTVYDLA